MSGHSCKKLSFVIYYTDIFCAAVKLIMTACFIKFSGDMIYGGDCEGP